MSYNLSPVGVYGVLLAEFDFCKELYNEFKENECDDEDEETQLWAPKFIKQFGKNGIVVPEGASLHFTDDEDSRADCGTPTNAWILGFGIFTMPWEWPEIDTSFRKVAQFHTWIWGG